MTFKSCNMFYLWFDMWCLILIISQTKKKLILILILIVGVHEFIILINYL